MRISAAQIFASIWIRMCRTEHGSICKPWIRRNFKSYSQIIAISLVDYFDRYYKKQEDPYLETREREERFVSQIVSAVETAMDRTLPVYLAGCMAGISQVIPQTTVATSEPEDADLDWDFLGE